MDYDHRLGSPERRLGGLFEGMIERGPQSGIGWFDNTGAGDFRQQWRALRRLQRVNIALQQISLTLTDLCGVGERIFHALPDMARDFYTVPARPGHERNLMRPYFAAHGGDSVAEGENSFWIPSGGSRLELS